MKVCSSCLFYDNEDHIWRFHINDNMDLMYSIMYGEDKWTKENKIDSEVLDFMVNIDKDDKIYIVYSVGTSLLKYCVWEENKWFGKTIYGSDNPHYEMTEINVITIGEQMHIFFIGKDNIKKDMCSLMHFSLNKYENLINIIDTIPFLKEAYYHYQVHCLNNQTLYLIYIKREENEVAINSTEYKNNKWSKSKRLYGIIGSSINFCTLLRSEKINILNLSKEGSLDLLEHVIIEPDGKMKSYKIHESYEDLSDFLLVEVRGRLFSIWTEGKDVLASSFNNKWSDPFKYYTELNNEISMYKYLSLSNKNKYIKCNYILGTNLPEINLLLPEKKIKEYIGEAQTDKIGEFKATLDYDAVKNKLNIQDKALRNLQTKNKNLEKRLIDLQIKYQEKLRIPEESDDAFIKLTNLKRKAEEKLNIITEIHQVSIKELQKLKADKISRDEIIYETKNKLQQLTYEYEGLKKQKISKDKAVSELTNQLQKLSIENEELSQDLKYEKNIGIVDRILKKKPER